MTRLVLICGLPSAGKTTLARRLGPALGAVQLRPDERMSDLGLDGHDEAARERVERLQWTLAQDLLRLGFSVVLESRYRRSRGQSERSRSAINCSAFTRVHRYRACTQATPDEARWSGHACHP